MSNNPYQNVGGQGQQQPAYNPYSQPPQPYYGSAQPQQPQVVYQQQYNQQQPLVYAAPQQQGYIPPRSNQPVKHVASDAESADYGQNNGDRFQSTPCRDVPFAILFLLHFIGMGVLAIVFVRMYGKDLGGDDNNSTDPNFQNNSDDEIKLNGHAWEMLFAFIFIGLISSFAMLELFKHHARKLIWASLVATPIFFCALALLAFAYLHQPIVGVILLIMAALNCLYLYFVRARINFSANILSITVQVLQQYPATTAFAFVCAAAQLVWCVIWLVAAAGAMHSIRNQEHTVVNPDGSTTTTGDSNGKVGVIWFFLLVSFYWTSQVIKNVTHVTVAGTLVSRSRSCRWVVHGCVAGRMCLLTFWCVVC
jgi:hypothetical protein